MDLTRYMDISLKSVPRKSPIPPNSVACVRRTACTDDPESPVALILSKNGQELVIECPPLRKIPEEFSDDEKYEVLANMVPEYLQILEDLVSTIEFGATSFAHLVPDPLTDGYQVILDYAKQLRRVSCPTWAPIIRLDEIEFTVWGAFSDRRGMWKGKPVDIFYAYNNLNMWRLNRAMYGFRRIDGLDFTFELYGHLVDRDGQVVGLVTEAAWGRPIRLSDKEFVASELKRLESHGYLYTPVHSNSFLIADGKLRFLQFTHIRKYTDPEDLKRDAAFIHTQQLDNLFQEFEDFGPFGYYRLLPEALTGQSQDISALRHFIPRGIWTAKLPVLQAYLLQSHMAPGVTADFIFEDVDPEGEEVPKRLVSLKVARGRQKNPLRLFYRASQNNALPRDDELPLSSRVRLRQRVFVSSTHPYARLELGNTQETR